MYRTVNLWWIFCAKFKKFAKTYTVFLRFSASRPELFDLVEINGRGGVFAMDILDIGAYVNYLPEITLGNDLNLFRINDPALLTPSSEGVQRLNSFASRSEIICIIRHNKN